VSSELLDGACRVLCHPDGGITGGGDGRCADFAATRKDGELLWRHPESAPFSGAGG
jgi:hypothetical protein